MNKKIQEFLKLPSVEKIFFVRALLVLPLVELRLRKFGLKPYAVMISSNTDKASDRMSVSETALKAEDIERQALLITRATRCIPIHVRCLARSLYLHKLLTKRKIHTVIVIGVETLGSDFNAHAWLELDGQVVNDSSDSVEKFIRIELTEERIARLSE